jgi:hypothetical protein
MNGLMKGVAGLMCAACLFVASAARADIPPPDACQAENAACDNAGERHDKDGVCKKATCTKGSASGQITSYDCFKCEATPVLGSAGTSTTTETDELKDDGGCSVGSLGKFGTEKGVAALMLGLGMVALGISRRRR